MDDKQNYYGYFNDVFLPQFGGKKKGLVLGSTSEDAISETIRSGKIGDVTKYVQDALAADASLEEKVIDVSATLLHAQEVYKTMAATKKFTPWLKAKGIDSSEAGMHTLMTHMGPPTAPHKPFLDSLEGETKAYIQNLYGASTKTGPRSALMKELSVGPLEKKVFNSMDKYYGESVFGSLEAEGVFNARIHASIDNKQDFAGAITNLFFPQIKRRSKAIVLANLV